MEKHGYYIETRQTHPQYVYETRPITCPDGVICLVTFTKAMWYWFDNMISRPVDSWEESVAFCWKLAKKYHPDTCPDAFIKGLHYKTTLHARTEKAKKQGKSIAFSIFFNGYARGDSREYDMYGNSL